MLDLFNSKYNCNKCYAKLRLKSDQLIHDYYKHRKSNVTTTLTTTTSQIEIESESESDENNVMQRRQKRIQMHILRLPI